MTPGRLRVAAGETLRWYLTRARHPLKDYVVGHWWWWFEQRHVWVRYDGDGVIHVRLGDYVQQRIFFDGFYERPLVDWLGLTLRDDDVFWDVGANVGALTVVAARRGARVVAFEPDPRSRAWLARNVAANALTNVTIVPDALGSEPGQGMLQQASADNLGRSSLVAGRLTDADSHAVSVTRADDFVADRPDEAPTVMKIDVEGGEHDVLAGAAGLLAAGRIRALVFEDRQNAQGGASNAAAVRLLREAGYTVDPFAASDPFADDGMMNFLATRGGDAR